MQKCMTRLLIFDLTLCTTQYYGFINCQEVQKHLFVLFQMYLNSGINVSPRGWDPTAACRASRGRCPEHHTSAPGRSSARCGPGKWQPTGGAGGVGLTAAPGSWLLGCPADRPPGGGESERVMQNDECERCLVVQMCTFRL